MSPMIDHHQTDILWPNTSVSPIYSWQQPPNPSVSALSETHFGAVSRPLSTSLSLFTMTRGDLEALCARTIKDPASITVDEIRVLGELIYAANNEIASSDVGESILDAILKLKD